MGGCEGMTTETVERKPGNVIRQLAKGGVVECHARLQNSRTMTLRKPMSAKACPDALINRRRVSAGDHACYWGNHD